MTRIVISRWGNSSAIRLPKSVMEELGLKDGETIEMTVEHGKAVLAPTKPGKITLDWIISEMQRLGPENEPETVDWGPDVGTEIIDDSDSGYR